MFCLFRSLENTFLSQWQLLGLNFGSSPRQRPYHVENTSSRPITEVKERWARLVLGWVTAWEHRVLLSFSLFFLITLTDNTNPLFK